ncbi:hypothetical protein [Flavobacterium crassostreae]|uniref:hypothetical protein n=1 Tax=Flavobacterium crassostreae TaxID=1763534 RepID=UPI0008A14001|nr:hypothetical protein [Flavobacterium crassostreae]
MNQLSKSVMNYSSKVRRKKSPTDFNLAVAFKQKEVKIPEANASICTNCDHYTHCMWQSNNKIFCEHYQ